MSTSSGSEAKGEVAGTVVAVLFELENLPVDGRSAVFSVLKASLADKDVKLTNDLFVRYCLQPDPRAYLPVLLQAVGKTRISAEKLAEEVSADITKALRSDKPAVRGDLLNLLRKAAQAGTSLGAATALDDETAARLLDRTGLKALDVKLFHASLRRNVFPTADTWLWAAKSFPSPQRCVVLATSGAACRAALAAGMCCVAIPDEFTAHDDYSGADITVERFDHGVANEILSFVASIRDLK